MVLLAGRVRVGHAAARVRRGCPWRPLAHGILGAMECFFIRSASRRGLTPSRDRLRLDRRRDRIRRTSVLDTDDNGHSAGVGIPRGKPSKEWLDSKCGSVEMVRTSAQRMPQAQLRSVPRLLVSVVLAAALAGCAPGPSGPTPAGPRQSSIPASTLAAPAPTAASTTAPTEQLSGIRRPRGVYAEQHLELVVAAQHKARPTITTAELRTFLKRRYTSLLGNPAISGLVIGMQWSSLNPYPASSGQP